MTADRAALDAALAGGGTADITTTGRRTGEPRRVEIWFHNLDGRIYISGRPGRPRGWYANLVAEPELCLHLKEGLERDVPARARPITGEPERREVLRRIVARVGQEDALDAWVAGSPLVELELDRDGA